MARRRHSIGASRDNRGRKGRRGRTVRQARLDRRVLKGRPGRRGRPGSATAISRARIRCRSLSSLRFEKFVSSQPEYSLLWRAPEDEVIPLCRKNEISQIVWSPLAEGVLTGKYRPGSPPPAETRATSERMGATIGRRLDEATLERVERLRSIGERLGYTTAQVALAWILRDDNVAAPIVGASRPDQVRENAVAADIDLDPETIAEIEAVFA